MKPAIRIALWIAALLAVAPAGFPQTGAVEHKPVAHLKKGDDPFLSGPPLTFEQVLRLLGEEAIPLQRRLQAIRSRGLDFSLSSDKIDKFKAAGASTETLDVIKSKAKFVAAAPPAPPKPPPTGSISVNCNPSECDVSLNGTAVGSTQSGKLEIAQLHPGKWTLDFKKNGYVGTQSIVVVEADRATSASAVLEPTHATLEAFGADLFAKVVQAVGGPGGLQQISSVQATGSATILGADGKSVRWSLVMRNRPDRALFQARAGGGILHEVTFQGSEYRASKNLKGAEALELPTDFGFVRDYQLAALLTKLSDPQYKIVSKQSSPVAGEEFSLFAEGGTEKISIGLDQELRPQRVRIVTATGIGSGLVLYGDYLKRDNASYPKTLQIKFDARQQGVDVRFDTVELNPKLTDNDYKIKGKPIVKSDD